MSLNIVAPDINRELEKLEHSLSAKPVLPDIGDKGKVFNTSQNLSCLLDSCGWLPCLNMMLHENEVLDKNSLPLGGSPEAQYSKLVDLCLLNGMSKESISDHLPALCYQRRYHPVEQWLTEHRWDGVDRVDKVIATLNIKDFELAKAVMWPWLIGCIASLYEDRFSTKLVPILQGGQSFKKSAWLSRIGSVVNGAFRDGSLNPTDRDSVKIAISSWILELGEMETTTRHESGILKAFITRHEDKYRAAYAKTESIKKRQTSFIGTVNGSGFLKDATGSTRFAVLEMKSEANIEKLNALLGWRFNGGRITQVEPMLLRQFWLEVKSKYDLGQGWILGDKTLENISVVNDDHTDKGAIYEKLMDYHFGKPMLNERWLTGGAVCDYHGDKPNMRNQYGKALQKMFEEGHVQRRNKRAGRKEYLLPFFTKPENDDGEAKR